MVNDYAKIVLILYSVLIVCYSDNFQRRRVFYDGGDYACMSGYPQQLDMINVTIYMVGEEKRNWLMFGCTLC